MTPAIYHLQQRRHLLCEEIAGSLDILMGSISTQGGNRPGVNLTFKVNGVTRSRYIWFGGNEQVAVSHCCTLGRRMRRTCVAYRKTKRGPKKKRPERKSGKRVQHVATAKLLAQRESAIMTP